MNLAAGTAGIEENALSVWDGLGCCLASILFCLGFGIGLVAVLLPILSGSCDLVASLGCLALVGFVVLLCLLLFVLAVLLTVGVPFPPCLGHLLNQKTKIISVLILTSLTLIVLH